MVLTFLYRVTQVILEKEAMKWGGVFTVNHVPLIHLRYIVL